MLYLLKGSCHISRYMVDGGRTEPRIALVEADSGKEAEDKFIKYFDKSEAYDVYYSVSVDEIIETII